MKLFFFILGPEPSLLSLLWYYHNLMSFRKTSLSRVMGIKLFLKKFKFENYNGTDLTTGLRSGWAAVIWKDRGHPTTVIVTRIFVSSSSPI